MSKHKGEKGSRTNKKAARLEEQEEYDPVLEKELQRKRTALKDELEYAAVAMAEKADKRRSSEQRAAALRRNRRAEHEVHLKRKVELAREEKRERVEQMEVKRKQKLASEKEEERAAPHPYVMMRSAIDLAEKKGSFDKEVFRREIKRQFLGSGFEAFKRKTDETMQEKLTDAENKFDRELDKLTNEVDKGIRNKSLETPQQNGIVKKCIRSLLHAVTALVTVATAYPAAVGYVAGAKMATTGSMAATAATVAAKVGVGAATVGSVVGAGAGVAAGGLLAYAVYKINSAIDSRSPSSRAEDLMDKLVETTNKAFGEHMAESSEKGVSNRKTAARFQDRVARIERHGKTHEGREQARRAERGAKGHGRGED